MFDYEAQICSLTKAFGGREGPREDKCFGGGTSPAAVVREEALADEKSGAAGIATILGAALLASDPDH